MGSADRIDDYELLQLAGRGGMGVVWRAVHVPTEVEVALKVLLAEHARKESNIRALGREVRSLCRLHHPGVVRVFDYGTVDRCDRAEIAQGSPYHAMEWVPDGSLETVGRELSWRGIRRVLTMLFDALTHAHARGVIHRDIKPGNILMEHTPVGLRPKLCDFGIAASLADADENDEETTSIFGTPAYMAPEQVTGTWRDSGPWTDLYAMGCVAYWLVSGRAPFAGPSAEIMIAKTREDAPVLSETRVAVPDGFHGWLARLLARTPTQRFRGAADAAWALARLEDPPDADAVAPEIDIADEPTITLQTVWEERPELENGRLAESSLPPIPQSWERAHVTSPIAGWASVKLFGLRPIPMVDREILRDMLWRRVQKVAQASEPLCVIVEGPRGVGRTRLVEWIGRRAEEVGAATLLHVRGNRDPFAFGHMMGRALRCYGLSEAEALERVRSWYAERADVDADALMDCVAFTSMMGHKSMELDHETMLQSAVRFLSLVCQERPVFLVLDDVEHADELVAIAARVLETNLPVVVIVVTDLAGTTSSVRAALRRLEGHERAFKQGVVSMYDTDYRKLIVSLLPLEPMLAEELYERTKGFPEHAVEIVRDFVLRGILVPTAFGLALVGERPILPESLQNIFWDRIWAALAAMQVDERDDSIRALHLASALGTTVNRAEWAATAQRAGVEIPGLLEERLREVGLIEDEALGWRWVQPLAREAVETHARADEKWERDNLVCAEVVRGAADVYGIWSTIRRGRHLFEGGAYPEAVDVLIAGAERARQAGLVAESQRCLDLHARAAEALGITGSDAPTVLRAEAARLVLSLMTGGEEALSELDALVERARNAPKDVLARALRVRGIARRIDGELGAAHDDLEYACRLFELAGDDEGLALALMNLSTVQKLQARFGEAREAASRAVATFARVGNLHREADATDVLAGVLAQMGDTGRARETLERARSLARACGSRMLVARATVGLSELERWLGNLDASDAAARQAEAVCDDPRFAGWWLLAHALNAVERGDTDALALLDEAQRASLVRPSYVDWATLQYARAVVAAREGDRAAFSGAVIAARSGIVGDKIDREAARFARRAANAGAARGWAEEAEEAARVAVRMEAALADLT